jgi:hypothetical protein
MRRWAWWVLAAALAWAVAGCGSAGGEQGALDWGVGPETSQGKDAAGDDAGAEADGSTGAEIVTGTEIAGEAAPEVAPADCVSGLDCEDSNRCTDQVCVDGHCQLSFNTVWCDDGDACTTGDVCAQGTCAGVARDCDDANACTTDSCKDGECRYAAVSGPECALTVRFLTPERGAALVAAGNLPVTGQVVSPAAAVKLLTVNGTVVEVGAGGSFSAMVGAWAGVNVLRAEVQDMLNRKASTTQAFLYADGFQPAGSAASPSLIDDATRVWLRVDVFDDDDTSDLDDLATLAWRAMDNLDLDAYIPHPLVFGKEKPSFGWCEWTIDLTQVRWDVTNVDLFPTDGGLYLSATLTDLSAYVDARAPQWFCPDAIGWIYADEVSIDVEMSVKVTGGKLAVGVKAVDVRVSGVTVDIQEGAASLFDWLVNWFSDSLSLKIAAAVEDWVGTSLAPMLNGVLNQFASYTASLDLPAVPGNPPGKPVSLTVRAASTDFTWEGAVLVLDAGAGASSAVDHPSPGSMLRGDCLGVDPGAFWLPRQDQVEAAMREDLANQALFALWRGGHLSVTVSVAELDTGMAGLTVSDVTAELDPLQAPVVTSCRTPGWLEAQVGDLFVKANFSLGDKPAELEMYVSLRLDARAKVVPGQARNSLGVELGNVQELAIDVVHGEGAGAGMEKLIENLVTATVVDGLLKQQLGGALGAWPIPAVDLGQFVPGLPDGSFVTFNPESLDAVDHGYVLIGGAVVAP